MKLSNFKWKYLLWAFLGMKPICGFSKKAPENRPMTAIGPTKNIIIDFATISYLSPDLLEAILKTKELDKSFSFQITLVYSFDEKAEVEQWIQENPLSKEILKSLNLIPLKHFDNIPSTTYIQDSLVFFWNDQTQKINLLSPNEPNVLKAYSELASKLNIPIYEFPIFTSEENQPKMLDGLVGYSGGGNWEFLPNNIAISIEPTIKKNFLAQLSKKKGVEYDYYFNSEKEVLKSEGNLSNNPQILKSQVNKSLNGPEYKTTFEFDTKIHKTYKDVFTKNNYKVSTFDTFSKYKDKLTQVDHIDEYLLFFKSQKGGNCNIGILKADPLASFKIIEKNVVKRSKKNKEVCKKTHLDLQENPYDTSLNREKINVAVQNGCLVEHGITDDEYINRKDDFLPKLKTQTKQINEVTKKIVDTLKKNSCSNPLAIDVPSNLILNISNSLVVTPYDTSKDSVIIRPEVFYKPLEKEIESILSKHQITSIKANSLNLAYGFGNFHCATSVITDSYRDNDLSKTETKAKASSKKKSPKYDPKI